MTSLSSAPAVGGPAVDEGTAPAHGQKPGIARAAQVARVRRRMVFERLLCDHSIPLAAMVAMAIVVVAIAGANRSLSRCAAQRRALTAVRTLLAAEEAAFAAAVMPASAPRSPIATSWGMAVDVERVRDGAERLEVTVPMRHGSSRFSCELLRGAAPACLGRRLTLGDEPAAADFAWVRGIDTPRDGSLPQLALPASASAALPGLFCDTEVAFLHLAGGTDRADYTLGNGRDEIRPEAGQEVVEVRGNLWLLPCARPLRVSLRAPLTIIVYGNVYLGRSIEVGGRVPLTLVAHRTGPTFRDLDGDGARSPGEPGLGGEGSPAIEGDGAVYLGLPRKDERAPLAVAAQVVAEGEIHVLTTVHMHGALVGGHGLTRCSPLAELDLTGRNLVDPSRTRIPGFATRGDPRPGPLNRVADPK